MTGKGSTAAPETDAGDAATSKTGTETVVSLENVSKVYDHTAGSPVTAVDDVTLDIERESVVGVLGPNGAGKTTLIELILGLVTPTSGTIRIGGVDVRSQGAELYQHVSAVTEGARNVYWRLTVRENMQLFAGLQGLDYTEYDSEFDRYLDLLDLTDKGDVPVRNLSRGMKQKCFVACTLAQRTPVVVFDEPTLGLDVEATSVLKRKLRELATVERKTILLCSHDMDLVQDVCERVVILQDGRVIADDDVESLLALFGTQSYQIAVEGRIPSTTRASLERRFDVTKWNDRPERTEFEVVLLSGDELYDLMDLLRDGGLTPIGAASTEPDLEEAFRRAVRSDRPLRASEEGNP